MLITPKTGLGLCTPGECGKQAWALAGPSRNGEQGGPQPSIRREKSNYCPQQRGSLQGWLWALEDHRSQSPLGHKKPHGPLLLYLGQILFVEAPQRPCGSGFPRWRALNLQESWAALHQALPTWIKSHPALELSTLLPEGLASLPRGRGSSPSLGPSSPLPQPWHLLHP